MSAGPGSGKTRIIVARIARLIRSGVDPKNILGTTFTKKAAEEMNERLISDGVNVSQMAIQTMHAFCWRFLRQEKFKEWEVDLENAFVGIIKRAIGYQGMKWRGCDITLVEQFIGIAKNSLVRPEDCDKWDVFAKEPFFSDRRYPEAYFHIEDLRQQRKMMTFDDMLIDGVELLQENPRVREQLQDKYEYVIVDEYQDSNLAQIKLVELVAAPQWNIMCVGDVDQAIYEWRGAVPQFMIDFPTERNAHVISMGTNYRCAPNIMGLAARCIAHNQARITKELDANKTIDAQVRLVQANDLDDEANIVGDEIEQLAVDGFPTGSMFVLYRTNAQSRAIEEVLCNRKIPHMVLGSSSFYQRKEVQDLLAYLKLVVDPHDYEAGSRAINRPFRYIKKELVDEIAYKTESQETTFCYTAQEVASEHNYRVQDAVGGFARVVEVLTNKYEEQCELRKERKKLPQETWTVGNYISNILEQTRYLDYLTSNEGSDTMENSREANVGELIRSADRYHDIKDYLEFVKWQIEERKKGKKVRNAVLCMTIHRAKGLEAKAVFIIGANDGLLPHAAAADPKEEERRLFYVGVTRAMDYLQVSHVRNLGMGNKVLVKSRFIDEAGLEEYRVGTINLTPAMANDTVDNSAGDQDAHSKDLL